MEPKLTDALELIQRAEKAVAKNVDDPAYCEMMNSIIRTFKQQLSGDTGLPIEYFNSDESDLPKSTSDEDILVANPTLLQRSHSSYIIIEMSI
ncbi:TPA: hypothetical protein DCZ39_03630 [Patescibacteria group bacterium]|nr:hypothetical protein [Candidatus Gracilibacteria bacterium]